MSRTRRIYNLKPRLFFDYLENSSVKNRNLIKNHEYYWTSYKQICMGHCSSCCYGYFVLPIIRRKHWNKRFYEHKAFAYDIILKC